MAMTRQQIFNTAYHGLAAQGFGQSKGGAGCAYRGEGGKRCALGYLIPDKIYNPDWDSQVFTGLMLARLNVTAELCSENAHFLDELQRAHDEACEPAIMKARLADFATRHNLTIPDLPDFAFDAPAERAIEHHR